MPRRVTCIPSSDEDFAAAASSALAGIDRDVHIDDVALTLAGLLRPAYPDVVVHRQDIMARVADSDVWYVYREGARRMPR